MTNRSPVSSETKRSKRRRLEYPENDMHKDIISQLPNEILLLIIARIPTKTAVSTSILSKRWRNLYKYLSSYRLDCATHLLPRYRKNKHGSYLELIIPRLEKFLRLCSSSKIDDLELDICLSKSTYNLFEPCIYYLGKSGINRLFLSYSCCGGGGFNDVPFPLDLLCEIPSLKFLILYMGSLQLNMKSKWYSLQSLHLWECTILPGTLECLLPNCLHLHSLCIDHCVCCPKFCINSTSLKTLTIIQSRRVEEIELHACNLSDFGLKSMSAVNLVFDYVPQLEILFVFFQSVNMMPNVYGEFRKYVPGIKFLTFNAFGGLHQSIKSMPFGIETFSNLRRLDICIYCTPETNLLALTPYLVSCPLLEELHLNLNVPEEESCPHTKELLTSKHVIVLHAKLKTVEMTGFCGTDNELAFALYILKSAISLDQMSILRCFKFCMHQSREDWCLKHFSHGKWRSCIRTSSWSKVTLHNIKQRLQGQAVSSTAKLIIQHQS